MRYNDFTQINRSYTSDFYTDNFFEIYKIVEELYDNNQSDKPIRLLGVSVSNLKDKVNNVRQMNLFKLGDIKKKDEAVIKMLNSINAIYGQEIIKKGAKK